MIKIVIKLAVCVLLFSNLGYSQTPSTVYFDKPVTLTGKVIYEDLVDPSENRIIKNAVVFKLSSKVRFVENPNLPPMGDFRDEKGLVSDEIRIYGDLSKNQDFSFLVDKYVTITATIEEAPSGHYPLYANILSNFNYKITGIARDASNDVSIKIHNFFINGGDKILSFCAHPTLSLDESDTRVNENNVVVDLYYGNHTRCELLIERNSVLLFDHIAVSFDNTGAQPFIVAKSIAQLAISYAESGDKKSQLGNSLEKVFNKTIGNWSGADWTVFVLDLCYKFS